MKVEASGETIKPKDITEGFIGHTVNVKGNLEFRRKTSGNYLYTLSVTYEDIIVRSEGEMREGKKVIKAEVDKIHDIKFLNPVPN